LLTTVLAFWIIGFAGDSILFQVLAIPASLIFLPSGIYLACSPLGTIGVESPENVEFSKTTVREGLTYVTRNTKAGDRLTCGGYAHPAK
jgi:hypothetical protein